MINIKCDLGFCDNFPEYKINDEELYYGPSYPLIHLSVYTYKIICAKHGIIPNGPTL